MSWIINYIIWFYYQQVTQFPLQHMFLWLHSCIFLNAQSIHEYTVFYLFLSTTHVWVCEYHFMVVALVVIWSQIKTIHIFADTSFMFVEFCRQTTPLTSFVIHSILYMDSMLCLLMRVINNKYYFFVFTLSLLAFWFPS